MTSYAIDRLYAPRVNADGVWQELPADMSDITFDALHAQTALPTKVEIELDDYCKQHEKDPQTFPLQESWAKDAHCPGCDEIAMTASNDYICIGCRLA